MPYGPQMHPVRRLWHLLETIHAVTYFAPQAADAAAAAGTKGFWMGYFGCRGAPLGEVPASVIEASFYNFTPAMVRRAVPDVWQFASPQELLAARREGATAALSGACDREAVRSDTLTFLKGAIEHADGAGRVLFAANRALVDADDDPTEDPLARLWQLATTLREHRGDSHVAVLVSEGIGGLAAHIMATAQRRGDPAMLRASRGWTEREWDDETRSLIDRGLLSNPNQLTDRGQDLWTLIEARTDELAGAPFDRSAGELETHTRALEGVARAVVDADIVAFPNPIGLPKFTLDR